MKKAIRIGIVSICCIAIIVGYYYYLSVRSAATASSNQVELSEVEYILSKDFNKDYPATPRAVVKMYNRIITALYAQEYTDKEFEQIADQLRMLLDEDLLGFNPRDMYIKNLSNEVTEYHNRNKVILNSSVCDTNDVTYATVKGDECAYVSAYYFTREASSFARTYEDFCLRKDDSGKWKILTFKLSEKPNDFK